MTDTIFLNRLTLPCIIGANEPERRTKQPVIISVALSVDLTKPSLTDNLSDTLSYSQIYRQITDLVEASGYVLLEGLAGAIAAVCLSHDQVRQVKVYIEKPKVLPLAQSAAVEITRSNEQ
jgi:FolB domain-containing protein